MTAVGTDWESRDPALGVVGWFRSRAPIALNGHECVSRHRHPTIVERNSRRSNKYVETLQATSPRTNYRAYLNNMIAVLIAMAAAVSGLWDCSSLPSSNLAQSRLDLLWAKFISCWCWCERWLTCSWGQPCLGFSRRKRIRSFPVRLR